MLSLSEILPAGVVCTEQVGNFSGTLHRDEELALSRTAAPERRSEFAAGRSCARRSLQALGLSASPILRGSDGQPLWPPSVVGSITHCAEYCAAAVAPDLLFATIGIDATPNLPLPHDVLALIASESESALLQHMPPACIQWDKLLFSIKEAVFKAWYPLHRRLLNPKEILVDMSSGDHTFAARVSEAAPPFRTSETFHVDGRYCADPYYIFTALAVPARTQA